jgi:hypothetical protein
MVITLGMLVPSLDIDGTHLVEHPGFDVQSTPRS